MRLPLPVADRATTPDRRPGRVVNVAHRGASAYAAENTLTAIRRAVALGADMVEVDVQRTKDGALVLMHDTTLARTTDVAQVYPGRAPWRVADLTYDELARLDAGGWRSSRLAGEPVPRLDETLDLLAQSGTGLVLELKAPELYPGIVSDVVATLGSRQDYVDTAVAAGRLVVESFSFAAMKDHKTQAPSVPVGLLGLPGRANLPALATWADQVNPSHLLVDATYVDQVHRLGMECLVWTVNHRRSMRRVLGMGVDGVITNRPDVLGDVLERSAAAV